MNDTEKQPISIEQQIGIKRTAPMDIKSIPKAPMILFISGLLMGILVIMISLWYLSGLITEYNNGLYGLQHIDLFTFISNRLFSGSWLQPLIIGFGIIFISLGGLFSIKQKSELSAK